jgi:CheY-like chemotaxis protein
MSSRGQAERLAFEHYLTLPLPAVSAGQGFRMSLRIVVTDDNPALLAKIVAMLQDAGHAVFAAVDGRSAFELAQYIPDLDLLITNTRLTNMNAPELIERVRRMKSWLAILHVGDPVPQDGPLAGVPTLREPFTAAELNEAIRVALLNRSQAAGLEPGESE